MNSYTKPESRIFPAIAVIALPALLWVMPQRYEIVPHGTSFMLGGALAVAMLASGLWPANAMVARVERFATAIVLTIATCLELVVLWRLLIDMIQKNSGFSGITLLTTSIGIWVINVLVFSLGYWQLDRGGPTRRHLGWTGRADFTFPRGDPEDGVPADWCPSFVDYLALGFNTSSAFSPTDVLPLTPRAKLLMMAQSSISLVTVIAVGARAINILGS